MKTEMPRIGLIGYGTMGKEIEKAAKSSGFVISAKYDIDNPLDIHSECDFDVAIDFSIPNAVFENIKILAEKKINTVIGATGWYDNLPLVKKVVDDSGIGLLWGSNFSVGMNIFMKLTQVAAKLINIAPGYDVFINEIHHKRKKDSPSGSAISLANIIMKEFQHKKRMIHSNCENEIASDALQVSSLRGGDIMGRHTVYIDSPSDTIEMTHNAKNREGFAHGALLAAAWINHKQGLFQFDDILDQIWFKND